MKYVHRTSDYFTVVPVAAVADTLCRMTTVTEMGKVSSPDTSSMASQINRSDSMAE